jgi:hypothetical protein
MITFALLPTWKDSITALIPGRTDNQELAKPWLREGDCPYLFSRSAWALQAIVFWWERYFQKSGPSVWIPAYFGNQSLWPLRQTSSKLFFYPVDDNLLPRWDVLEATLEYNKPDIFVLVHYFGCPSDARKAGKFCSQAGAVMVEDAAHVFHPIPGIGAEGDFVFYSPHKVLAIPFGSVLVMRAFSNKFKKDGIKPARELMDEVHRQLTKKAASPWPWLIKRLIQKTVIYKWLKYRKKIATQSFFDDPPTVALTPTPGLSKTSLKLMAQALKSLPDVATRRKRNRELMRSLLEPKGDWRLLPHLDNDLAIPYNLVFRCETPEIAAARYEEMTGKGQLVQSWPDLPPEVLREQDRHATAIGLRKTLLTFPVHQTLSVDELTALYSDSPGA